MNIHIASDLHLEIAPYSPPAINADIIVLAGDIHTKRRDVEWAIQAYGDRPIVMIGGNHTAYRGSVPNTIRALKKDAADSKNVHFLENDVVTIDGARFLGCTLWTNCRYWDGVTHDEPDYATPEQWMNDYRYIRMAPTFRRLRARDTAAMHDASARWLREELAKPFDGPTVVVTHHAPSAKSALYSDARGNLAMAYLSELDELVENSGASLWVHGHTHVSVDYRIGSTRVVANQRGYPGQPTGFDSKLLVTL